MPGIIPSIDGIHAIMFHMEHSGGESWQYRWRITGDVPVGYDVWRSATTAENHALVASEVRDAAIEAEWRPDNASPWRQFDLLRLLPGECRFSFRAEDGFSSPTPFTAVAAVRDAGVAAYHFPPAEIPPGGEAVLTGRADSPAWPNVLLAPGEFRPVVPGLAIENLGPTTGAWEAVPHSGAFALSACPLATARRYFAVAGRTLTPHLP